MSAVLIDVVKNYGGTTWGNTHCVMVGSSVGVPSDADLDTIGAGVALTATNTAPSSAANVLQAIVAFERAWLGSDVNITRIYITDGRRNDLQPRDAYAVQNVTIAGNGRGGAFVGGTTVAPGGVCLVVNRNPSGYSHRPGRLFLRLAILDTEVRVSGPKLVDFTDATTQTQFVTNVSNVVGSSRLGTYFLGGTNAAVATYCIPQYYSTKTAPTPHQVGELIGATPVASMTLGGVALRQVQRGRRHKAAAFG